MLQSKSESASAAICVRYSDGEKRWWPGSYVIGRHKSCDLVLESSLVSRRHAQLDVARGSAVLTDLGSANGVYVNGERVTGAANLRSGDRLMLGDQSLEVMLGTASGPVSVDRQKLATAQPLWIIPVDDDVDVPSSSERSAPGTGQVDFFELVGRVMDRVLAEQRFDEAITMLRSHLNRVLSDAQSGRSVAPGQRDASLRYSALLAAGTRDPQWVDYALDLLAACRCAPAQEIGEDIEEAVVAIGSVDSQRLGRYVAAVEGVPDALERLRAVTFARLLERIARRSR